MTMRYKSLLGSYECVTTSTKIIEYPDELIELYLQYPFKIKLYVYIYIYMRKKCNCGNIPSYEMTYPDINYVGPELNQLGNDDNIPIDEMGHNILNYGAPEIAIIVPFIAQFEIRSQSNLTYTGTEAEIIKPNNPLLFNYGISLLENGKIFFRIFTGSVQKYIIELNFPYPVSSGLIALSLVIETNGTLIPNNFAFTPAPSILVQIPVELHDGDQVWLENRKGYNLTLATPPNRPLGYRLTVSVIPV
ncbi:MAG: hypothetical protein Hyperionvirus5_107 [Hyperionvirus sp.]|uniref:Uncharacterized protein n=1 Tax=Hyperionvirus sp. TaxID=2487770 RepID=A0A3G5AAQ0_9VIRU|nr:MAG: hypothetical protein Hyperionvirus5_107 [Hyperionvirus sp.]